MFILSRGWIECERPKNYFFDVHILLKPPSPHTLSTPDLPSMRTSLVDISSDDLPRLSLISQILRTVNRFWIFQMARPYTTHEEK